MHTSVESGFLDNQLAELLLKICKAEGVLLNTTQQQQLSILTQQVSAATRQGTIAFPLKHLENPIDWLLLADLPVCGQPGDFAPLIHEAGYVWLNRYWQYEQRLATNLSGRLQHLLLNQEQLTDIEEQLDSWYPPSATEQIDWQRQAVAMAAQRQFLIISGGPGTGKTTTVLRLLCLLIEQLQVQPQRILMAAPTGKAAMRLLESIRQAKLRLQLPDALVNKIPEQASTLHRLLGYVPGRLEFKYHVQHCLPADVVIVDEASMIDISLMTHLFEAVSPHARLILLGDKDQLASVETGSVFRDLCRQEDDTKQLDRHIVVLQKSWRFAADSGIGQLATSVREGEQTHLQELLEQDWPDLHWDQSTSLTMGQFQEAWQDYLQLAKLPYTHIDTAGLAEIFQAFNRFRILTPLRQGGLGTEQLNRHLNRFMCQHLEQPFGNWYAGRPVMVTQNDYRQQLFNGDIGLTLADQSGQLRVWFQDGEHFRAIAPVRLPQHETAWAMTIHKSQGSEFDEVFLVLPENEEMRILGRELLYTGITRAKQRLQIQGSLAVLQRAVALVMPPSSRIRERLP